LINGRGAIYCLSADELYSYETPYLKAAIDNLNLTDKGYVLEKKKLLANPPLTFIIQMLSKHFRNPGELLV